MSKLKDPTLDTRSELKKGNKTIQSKVLAWLYQNEETVMMDIVRGELQQLGKTVLANIHDAIVVRDKLTAAELAAIESKVQLQRKVDHWQLGEKHLQVFGPGLSDPRL